jgi:2-oxoglutarate ferredoxin oxidoreductase subunit alpha
MVAGEAGQGVQSVGMLLSRAFSRWGYHVFADQDYESRIRGGHNFFRVRASHVSVGAINESLDILIAFNRESIELHRGEVTKDGIIIYDGEKIKDVTGEKLLDIPMEKLAVESAGDRLMSNTVALAGALALVGFDFNVLAQLLRDFFKGETGEKNIKAAQAGYDYVLKALINGFNKKLTAINARKRIMLSGNEAMALGAIAAGCKFMAAYPMTPVTGIMEYLAGKQQDCGLVVVPAEDEIAAINMVVGAAYAGVRAMTATSGGGFCLMVEGVGLAGMTETPVVIIEGQRTGPAIGLPTRTEQGDLEFVMYAAHGEFPRAVLAPATTEDCFWCMPRAFNIAEKYQLPVLVTTDQYLASSYATVEPFDVTQVIIDRGVLYNGGSDKEYKRHASTDTGVSPRAFPGRTGALVVTDSDEHNEAGHPIEDASTRALMMQKRLRKTYGLKKETAPPRLYGPKKADTLLIGWGSTYGAMKEAVDILHREKASVNLLHFSELLPFPVQEVTERMSEARRTYVVENNATGQFARLIRQETGRAVNGNILKYDGRPFTPALVVAGVKKEGC